MLAGARIVAALGKGHGRMRLVAHIVTHPCRLFHFCDERIALHEACVERVTEHASPLGIFRSAYRPLHRRVDQHIGYKAKNAKSYRHHTEPQINVS